MNFGVFDGGRDDAVGCYRGGKKAAVRPRFGDIRFCFQWLVIALLICIPSPGMYRRMGLPIVCKLLAYSLFSSGHIRPSGQRSDGEPAHVLRAEFPLGCVDCCLSCEEGRPIEMA